MDVKILVDSQDASADTSVADGQYLSDRYGKHADAEFLYEEKPVVSFPFMVLDLPAGTKCFCLTLVDHDAIPAFGFTWIHWSVANVMVPSVPEISVKIPEDFSRAQSGGVPQGANSFGSHLIGETDPKITTRYVGPMPPDRDHSYTLTVYALSELVDVADGFFLNELYKQMDGKILAEASCNVLSRV